MTKIEKKNWVSKFNLLGEVRLNDNTFQIDNVSTNSNWQYSRMNLCVKCGDESGNIYVEMMGGFDNKSSSVIYAHGKTDDGRDDFTQRMQVAWEDRNNPDTLEQIGELCFIQIGLEKTESGKVFYNKFLSEYDAITYLKETLHDGDKVYVSGNLKYSIYDGVTQVRKNVTRITIYTPKEGGTEFKPYAKFTQSILIDKNSSSLKDIDKEKGTMYIHSKVLDYLKELNGVQIKGQYPYSVDFEFKLDLNNKNLCEAIYKKLFDVKKDWTQITFDGKFIESGSTTTVTIDDVTDDIKELIEAGIYTEEEVLETVAVNGNRERRMVLLKPIITFIGEDDNKVPMVAKFENRYTDEDLIVDVGVSSSDFDNAIDISGDDDMDWLNKL